MTFFYKKETKKIELVARPGFLGNLFLLCHDIFQLKKFITDLVTVFGDRFLVGFLVLSNLRENVSFFKTSGNYFFLLFLRATSLSPSWTLEGLFELTQRPSRALDSPRALLPELQRYKDFCARRRGPRTLSTTADANLDCAFVENELFPPILDCEKSTEYN